MTDAESAKNSPAGLLAWQEYEQRRDQQLEEGFRKDRNNPPLQIKTVRYGLTVHTGNFSSVRLDAEADVPTDGTAESTLLALENWVRSASPCSTDYLDSQKAEATMIEDDIMKLEKRRDLLEAEYQKFRTVFKFMGIEPGLPAVEDLPF